MIRPVPLTLMIDAAVVLSLAAVLVGPRDVCRVVAVKVPPEMFIVVFVPWPFEVVRVPKVMLPPVWVYNWDSAALFDPNEAAWFVKTRVLPAPTVIAPLPIISLRPVIVAPVRSTVPPPPILIPTLVLFHVPVKARVPAPAVVMAVSLAALRESAPPRISLPPATVVKVRSAVPRSMPKLSVWTLVPSLLVTLPPRVMALPPMTKGLAPALKVSPPIDKAVMSLLRVVTPEVVAKMRESPAAGGAVPPTSAVQLPATFQLAVAPSFQVTLPTANAV